MNSGNKNKNKKMNIIITGASRGIGKELSLNFLEKGHSVFGLSRSEKLLQEVSNEKKYYYQNIDLSNSEEIKSLKIPFDKVDILINNAGILINKPFDELTEIDFINSLKVNYLAPITLIQTLKEYFTKNAHIVNISTMGAIQGSVKFSTLSAYGGSKAALCHLTEILSEEYKDTGIAINCLALGAVQTEMLESAFPDFKATISAKEMASFIVDFSLKGNKFFNGKIIPVSSSTP